MPDCWQANLVPGVWLQGPGIPELVSVIEGGGLVPDMVGFGVSVSQSLHWLASGKGQGEAGLRVWSGLFLADSFHRLQDHSFLACGVCPLVGESGLEACAGFLAGRVSACPLVGRALGSGSL